MGSRVPNRYKIGQNRQMCSVLKKPPHIRPCVPKRVQRSESCTTRAIRLVPGGTVSKTVFGSNRTTRPARARCSSAHVNRTMADMHVEILLSGGIRVSRKDDDKLGQIRAFGNVDLGYHLHKHAICRKTDRPLSCENVVGSSLRADRGQGWVVGRVRPDRPAAAAWGASNGPLWRGGRGARGRVGGCGGPVDARSGAEMWDG